MEGQGENEELYPIAVLIDELKVNLTTKRCCIHQIDFAPSMTMCC